MIKRKSLITTFTFIVMLSFALFLSVMLFDGTFTAQAAEMASCVAIKGNNLYDGQYLESNDATEKKINAKTEPAQYVAWYKDGILSLKDYDGDTISAGGDLTIKLNGRNIITSEFEGIFVSDCENFIIDADSEGTLDINVSSNADDVFGISVGRSAGTRGNVTITGKSKVNIVCQTTNYMAFGIYSKDVFGIVGEASLDIKCVSKKVVSPGDSYGIYSDETPVFNTNGAIKIDTSECASESYCVYSAMKLLNLRSGDCLFKYKPSSRSYALYPTMENTPDGYVMHKSVSDGEDVLRKGEVHTVTIEKGLDYYQKSTNQYAVGETVTIKAGIENLNFVRWESEEVTFEDATQKETTFVMVNKDVKVKAIYEVFAKQPIFERINDDKGSISVQVNKQTTDIVLIKSDGEVDVNVSFSLDSLSDKHTYVAKTVWASQTPAGKYRIRTEYNDYYFYSEPFDIDYADKNPHAKISDVIINGKRGREITPISFDVTLFNATFKAIPADTDVSSWFHYLTNGLVAKISAVTEGAMSSTITISGTPTDTATSAIYLTIPKEVLASGNDKEIFSKYNSSSRFNIVVPDSFDVIVTNGKAQVGGKTKTNIEEGSIVTIVADIIAGYVFEKWVVVSGGITLTSENNETTKFVMPKNRVEVKAVFKELPHIHSYTMVPGKEATCVATGIKEHFKCDECGKLFDVDKKEITEEELTLAIDPSAHDLVTEWTPTSEGHYHICKNGCEAGHDKLQDHIPDRENATETDPVKCTECGYMISPILGHKHHLSEVRGIEATCQEDGRKAYFACAGCECKFKDEAGTEEITDESWLVIPKAHKFGAWIVEVPSTTEKTGTKAHKSCEFCHKHFDKDDNEIEDLTIPKLPKLTYKTTIENGSANGTTFEAGQTVIITANTAPEGKEFDKWIVVSGEVILTDANSSTTTFVMPDGEVEIKATYKDKIPSGGEIPGTDDPNGEIVPTPRGKGLNGGAIAGIVIGSVVVVGLGGFAIFWFVIKKKSFAELIATIKGK